MLALVADFCDTSNMATTHTTNEGNMDNTATITIGSKVKHSVSGATGVVFMLTTGNGAHVRWAKSTLGRKQTVAFGTKAQLHTLELSA